LKQFSVKADLLAAGQNAKTLAEELRKKLSGSDKVLYIKAAEGSKDVEEILSGVCRLETISLYTNQNCDFELQEIAADYICFTSASGAERILSKGKIAENTKIVSIGASTSSAVMKYGYYDYIQAKNSSYEGILESIMQDVTGM